MNENHDHYFTESPSTDFRSREILVSLAGRDLTLETAGGVFSPEHLDTGTRILLGEADDLPTTGTFLDVGCGWGPIALAMGLQSPEATVWAVDINERARELTARNAARCGLDNVHVAAPDEVPEDLRFDVIWSNPPIRVGKEALHELLLTWLARLTPTGEAWLVVAKGLGAPSLLTWLNASLPTDWQAVRVSQDKGFHVIRVARTD